MKTLILSDSLHQNARLRTLQGLKLSACTINGSTIVQKHDYQREQRFTLDDEMRGFIKDALLNQLTHQIPSVVKDAGICLGIIAAVELPQGKWPDFLNIMAQNSTNENSQYRLAAVQALGQMMEFIDQYETRLDNQQVGQVLHSMILNIDEQNIELTKIAI